MCDVQPLDQGAEPTVLNPAKSNNRRSGMPGAFRVADRSLGGSQRPGATPVFSGRPTGLKCLQFQSPHC
jgi:hypothetical protein